MKHKRHLIILGILIILGFIFWYSRDFQDTFYEIIDSLKIILGENRLTGSVIFVVLGVLSSMFSPFSSLPLVPAAIIYWGNAYTLFLLTLSWFLGGAVTYAIGRYAGTPILRRLLDIQKIEYFKTRIKKAATFWLVFLFKLSIPAEITGYTMGILHYHFPKYLLATLLAEIPFAALAVFASDALLAKKPMYYIGAAIIGTIAIITLLSFFKRYLKTYKL